MAPEHFQSAPFTGSSASKKETSIPVLSFSCSNILQVHPVCQALCLTLYQEAPRLKACCGPHLTRGEIQSRVLSYTPKVTARGQQRPQFDLTVRQPSSLPGLSKQNAQWHQIWNKSPGADGKDHGSSNLVLGERVSVP